MYILGNCGFHCFSRTRFFEFQKAKTENGKLMQFCKGIPPSLGLWDNQFTWQHRAKNIGTALKIPGEIEKRRWVCVCVGVLSLHTPNLTDLKMVLPYRDTTGTKNEVHVCHGIRNH